MLTEPPSPTKMNMVSGISVLQGYRRLLFFLKSSFLHLTCFPPYRIFVTFGERRFYKKHLKHKDLRQNSSISATSVISCFSSGNAHLCEEGKGLFPECPSQLRTGVSPTATSIPPIMITTSIPTTAFLIGKSRR